jgi:serine/threonine protein kinase
MPLSVGDKLGPYEILAAIGAGGMGEVYRARDTKLDRNVAIKVLPSALARDPERLARFEREAKVLASLNHANIAQIYGVEESSAGRALVMELVPGQTLKGPLPLAEAVRIAGQIASALEAAHDKGIVHRDLKPANIMITPEGAVKVLDFGLAAVLQPSTGRESDPNNSPTLTMAATQAGVIMGTAGYMSPEQASGRPVDKRADIWAFGVILWEMLSGQQLFAGETISHTMAAVLTKELDFQQAPPKVRRMLARCLERDPKRRLRDIGDAMPLLEDQPEDAPAPFAAPPSRHPLIWIVAAAICLLAAAGLAFVHFRETPPPQLVASFQVPLPDNTSGVIFQLSPNGRVLAFSATQGGRRQIWLRPIDSLVAQVLPGTEDATYMFWSPDSTFLGFFVPGKLKKIALSGGPPQTLCDAADGRGGTWNSDGVIVFTPGPGAALARVSAAGGAPVFVTKLSTPDELHRYPAFLPDGNRFLFLRNNAGPQNGIYVGSLDGTTPVRILPDESSAVYVPATITSRPGHLLFRREGTLMAQPFDPSATHTAGDAFPVAEHVGVSGNTNFGAFTASQNGVLAHAVGGLNAGQLRELVWMDRGGKRLGTAGQPGLINYASLSPDERRVSFSLGTPAGDLTDLWLLDLVRGVPTRFTFRSGNSNDGVWSPDESRIVFQADNTAIYLKPANGAGNEEMLIKTGINARPTDWSRDGKFVVYMQFSGTRGNDLLLLPMEGDRKPIPYLQTPFNEANAQFSPDGKWMAYSSNESGSPQVYVQPIPTTGAKWQISAAGGDQPRWRRDGKELFYISSDQKLTAVPVKSGATFEAGSPQALFEIQPLFPPLGGRFAYQPTADGQRFLALANTGGTAPPPVTVVLNWQVGLRK